MRRVGLVLDPCFERHETGPGHPERSERIATLRDRLQRSDVVSNCVRMDVEDATDEMLVAVHDREYLAHVARVCESGEQFLDSLDTAVCPESEKVARMAAGSLAALCRRVAEGDLGCAVMCFTSHTPEGVSRFTGFLYRRQSCPA